LRLSATKLDIRFEWKKERNFVQIPPFFQTVDTKKVESFFQALNFLFQSIL